MLTELLSQLKMPGALEELPKIEQRVQDRDEFVRLLLQAEKSYRANRQTQRRLSQARFTIVKEWSEVDPELNPKIEFKRIERHFDGSFVEKHQNLCLLGKQGTGKTHCLIALGRALCRRGITVRFFTACHLVNLLEESRQNHTLTKLMNQIQIPKLLIIDEFGFVPFSENGARLIFDVFASRYERGSIAVSTNLSFEKWTQVLGSVELTAALVDRFTHKADVIPFEGESVRLMQTKRIKNLDKGLI
jgi:DNA replication protein DnaC